MREASRQRHHESRVVARLIYLLTEKVTRQHFQLRVYERQGVIPLFTSLDEKP